MVGVAVGSSGWGVEDGAEVGEVGLAVVGIQACVALDDFVRVRFGVAVGVEVGVHVDVTAGVLVGTADGATVADIDTVGVTGGVTISVAVGVRLGIAAGVWLSLLGFLLVLLRLASLLVSSS
jgi:hypothetical protein